MKRSELRQIIREELLNELDVADDLYGKARYLGKLVGELEKQAKFAGTPGYGEKRIIMKYINSIDKELRTIERIAEKLS